MPDEQNVFYHYTSIDALYNIVSNRTFWLANAKSSNDKTEGNFSVEEFCNMLSDMKSRFNEQAVKEAIDVFILEKNALLTPENRKFYILSLTIKRDNLSHWERYATAKQGISLALSSNFFDLLDENIYTLFRKSVLSDFDLIYSYSDCVNKITNFIDRFLKDFEKFKYKDVVVILKSCFAALFYEILSCIKNEYFQDESEHRILLDIINVESCLNTINIAIKKSNTKEMNGIREGFINFLRCIDLEQTYFAPIRGEIRSLHHLNLSKIWGSDLISEIMLGPNCPQSKDELRAFLDTNGLQGTKITESKIPIR